MEAMMSQSDFDLLEAARGTLATFPWKAASDFIDISEDYERSVGRFLGSA
jgi:hypothetical protein